MNNLGDDKRLKCKVEKRGRYGESIVVAEVLEDIRYFNRMNNMCVVMKKGTKLELLQDYRSFVGGYSFAHVTVEKTYSHNRGTYYDDVYECLGHSRISGIKHYPQTPIEAVSVMLVHATNMDAEEGHSYSFNSAKKHFGYFGIHYTRMWMKARLWRLLERRKTGGR